MGLLTVIVLLAWFSKIYLSPLLTTLSTNESTPSDIMGTLTPTPTAVFIPTIATALNDNTYAVLTPTFTATVTAIALTSQTLPLSLTATSAAIESAVPITVPITITPTPFITPTLTETATSTPSKIATESATPSLTPTETRSATPTSTATESLTATNTNTPTATPLAVHTTTLLATKSSPAISTPISTTVQRAASNTSATLIAPELSMPTFTVTSVVNKPTVTSGATATLTPKPIATDHSIATTTVTTMEVVSITLTATFATSTPFSSTPSEELVATITAIDTLISQVEGSLPRIPSATAMDTVTPTTTATLTATPTPTRRPAPATLGQVISIDASDPKLSCTGTSPAVWFNGTQVSLTRLKSFTLPTNEVFEIVAYEHGYDPLKPGNHAFVIGRPGTGATAKLEFTNVNLDPEYIVVVVRFRKTNPKKYVEQLSSNVCRIRIGR